MLPLIKQEPEPIVSLCVDQCLALRLSLARIVGNVLAEVMAHCCDREEDEREDDTRRSGHRFTLAYASSKAARQGRGEGCVERDADDGKLHARRDSSIRGIRLMSGWAAAQTARRGRTAPLIEQSARH